MSFASPTYGLPEDFEIPSGARFGVVASRFNVEIVDDLLQGVRSTFEKFHLKEDALEVWRVPGAWEIPWACQTMSRRTPMSAIVALGAVIRGDTPHFEFISSAVSQGCQRVSLDEQVPVIFGVLTTDTFEQARVRADVQGQNKGAEAALAALELACVHGHT